MRRLSSYLVLAGTGLLILSYQNCSSGFQPAAGIRSNLPSNGGADVAVDGKSLYATNCQACHGPLAVSTKRGRSAAQISGALSAVPEMSVIRLTALEIEVIASALVQTPTGPLTDVAAAEKYFPEAATGKDAKRIYRLTREQLDKTVSSLLGAYSLPSIKGVLPPDPLVTNYEYAEVLNFNGANFVPLKNWIESAAAAVKAKPQSVIDCAAANNSVECLTTQARSFVTKAFRGDVSPQKLTELTNFYVNGVTKYGYASATANLVDVVLSSPQFLFREEFETTPAAELVAAEQLQLLTYGLADVPPEKLTFASGNAATYLQGPTKATTVDAILQSADARAKLSRFFLAWLEVKEPGEFTIATAVYPEFTAQVALSAVNETKKFLGFHLGKPAPSLKDITRATQSYVDTSMAGIYDMSTPDAQGNTLVNLDASQRFGIFSHASVIASHSGPDSSRLVKRGAFFARKVMCIPIAGTPPGVNTNLPPGNSLTQRQKVETVTNDPKCLGCHSTLNPMGFFQENYSASGKWRTSDSGLPIDAKISFDALDEGPFNAIGPVETLSELTASIMFKQCFIRQLFRYYVGRNETPSDDPVLKEMFLAFMQNGREDVVAALKVLANSSRLTNR